MTSTPTPQLVVSPASDNTNITRAADAAPVQPAHTKRKMYENVEGVSRVSKAELLGQRAKKLGERFGLDIDLSHWQAVPVDDTVLRIDKPIRMRVRRACHLCSTIFGSAKECPNCTHARCTECTRYPPKRSEAEAFASRERKAAVQKANEENPPLVADYFWNDRDVVLTRPSKSGGQDLIHKKPRQRVRRFCHECQTSFSGNSKKCENCDHVRCTDCPRDPPKLDKYPFGYPGDEFGPNSIPYYDCDRCKTLYPVGAEHGTQCKKCGREKSDASPRALPRRVDPEPDPEILKSIQAKLDMLIGA